MSNHSSPDHQLLGLGRIGERPLIQFGRIKFGERLDVVCALHSLDQRVLRGVLGDHVLPTVGLGKPGQELLRRGLVLGCRGARLVPGEGLSDLL